MNTIPSDWTPTTPNINALPDPIRHYIHQLETRTDPAGDVRRIAELKDQVEALQVMLSQARQSLRDEFAMSALVTTGPGMAAKLRAHLAYQAADAMLEARKEREG